jgi:hypothetical protein
VNKLMLRSLNRRLSRADRWVALNVIELNSACVSRRLTRNLGSGVRISSGAPFNSSTYEKAPFEKPILNRLFQTAFSALYHVIGAGAHKPPRSIVQGGEPQKCKCLQFVELALR